MTDKPSIPNEEELPIVEPPEDYDPDEDDGECFDIQHIIQQE